MLKVSKGNTKLGSIANVSLPPILSCRPGVLCGTDGCYAMKAYRMYPGTRRAWDGNFELWKKQPLSFEFELIEWLQHRNKLTHFRWHVGGDIPDQEYALMMIRIANRFPNIHFMAFTKRTDILSFQEFARFKESPNLTVRVSMWPGEYIPITGPGIDKTWLSEDDRKPHAYFKCHGNCTNCKACWDLRGYDVVFDRH